MPEPVAINIEYRSDDFVSASLWTFWRSPVPYISLVFMAGVSSLIVFAMFQLFDDLFGYASIVGVVIGTAIGIPRAIAARAGQARKSFESTQAFQHPVIWVLSERELHVKGRGIEAKLEWNNYMRAAETKLGFILWQSRAVYNYLPKRALPDKETLARVRDVIRTGLPGTAKIKLLET